jgi:hypothetical protein
MKNIKCRAKNPSMCPHHGYILKKSVQKRVRKNEDIKRKINSTFVDHEEDIRRLFKLNSSVFFEGSQYYIVDVFKPHTDTGGEPKTDIFVLISDNNGLPKQMKITYKKSNSEFLENKASEERASLILGANYKTIISSSAKSLKVDKRQFYNYSKNSYVLGYRLDIMSVPAKGYAPVVLTEQQLKEIYSGSNIEENKRNAIIGNERLANSGIADYILVGDSFKGAQDVIDNMIHIDKYVKKNPKVFIAFKAVNYFADADKWDGNRPLALNVKWEKNNKGILVGTLDTNEIYITTCNPAVAHLKKLLF